MKFNVRFFIQLLLSSGLAILLLIYIFSTVKLEDLLAELKKANYLWILLSVLASMVAHLSRAARWGLLLEPLNYKPNLKNSFQAVIIGYFANYAVPRLGEVVRCGILKRTDDVPVNVSLGCVITERVIDLFVMLMVFIGCFIWEFQRLNLFITDLLRQKGAGIEQLTTSGFFLFMVVSAFVLMTSLIVFIYINRVRLYQKPIIKKITDFIMGIVQGMMSITKLKKIHLFLLHTAIIWMAYYAMTYLMFFSLPDTSSLPLMAGWVALALGSLAMVAPVQGGIGAYHIMVSAALLIYGIPQQKGLMVATILHSSQFIATIIVGGVCLINVLTFTKKRTSPETVPVV